MKKGLYSKIIKWLMLKGTVNVISIESPFNKGLSHSQGFPPSLIISKRGFSVHVTCGFKIEINDIFLIVSQIKI